MNEETKPEAGQDTLSFFDRGLDAFLKITDAVKRNGIRNATVGAGITTLLVLLLEFLTKKTDYIPNQGEIAFLVIGPILIVIALIITSLEYRWELTFKNRQRELINEQLKLKAHFNLERLKKTDITKQNDKSEEQEDKPKRPQ